MRENFLEEPRAYNNAVNTLLINMHSDQLKHIERIKISNSSIHVPLVLPVILKGYTYYLSIGSVL